MIREAMRGKDLVAIGCLVLAEREQVLMLKPRDKATRHVGPAGPAGRMGNRRVTTTGYIRRSRRIAFLGRQRRR